jgi:hypothetical protein
MGINFQCFIQIFPFLNQRDHCICPLSNKPFHVCKFHRESCLGFLWFVQVFCELASKCCFCPHRILLCFTGCRQFCRLLLLPDLQWSLLDWSFCEVSFEILAVVCPQVGSCEIYCSREIRNVRAIDSRGFSTPEFQAPKQIRVWSLLWKSKERIAYHARKQICNKTRSSSSSVVVNKFLADGKEGSHRPRTSKTPWQSEDSDTRNTSYYANTTLTWLSYTHILSLFVMISSLSIALAWI